MLSGADSPDGAHSREASLHCNSAQGPSTPPTSSWTAPGWVGVAGCESSPQRKRLGGLQNSAAFLLEAPGKHNKHRPSSPSPSLAPARPQPQPQPQCGLWRVYLGLRDHFTAQGKGLSVSPVRPTSLPHLTHCGLLGSGGCDCRPLSVISALPPAHLSSLGFHGAARPVLTPRAGGLPGPTPAQPLQLGPQSQVLDSRWLLMEPLLSASGTFLSWGWGYRGKKDRVCADL